MHLAIPFTLLLGSFVAAAPSFQHAQISVDITNMETQGQVDALYSSDELEVHHGGHHIHKDLPFNFTLSARHASGHPRAGLPFEFERLNGRDSIRGELGFTTIFAFRDGKLISGNRALGYDPRRPWPPWTALWPLEIKEPVQFFHLIGVSESSGGILHYFIEFENRGKLTSGTFILISFIYLILEGANWWNLIERKRLRRLPY